MSHPECLKHSNYFNFTGRTKVNDSDICAQNYPKPKCEKNMKKQKPKCEKKKTKCEKNIKKQ